MQAKSGLKIKINGKWLMLSDEFVHNHPGGPVITQYSNADATHIFHAFHEGSAKAYKQLDSLEKRNKIDYPGQDPTEVYKVNPKDVNIASYDISIEEEKKIVLNFEKLRQRFHDEGFMDVRVDFYVRKTIETMFIMLFSFYLQYAGWYLTSACFLALAFQQFGWLTHEYCHHQVLKNRSLNDSFSLFFGNVCQGFSRDWWKNKHNNHHAATNVVDQDDDIDLAPLIAMVPDDLKKYKQPIEQFLLNFIPFQHLYFSLMLPLIRISWTSQSVQFVFFTAQNSEYRQFRKDALGEQTTDGQRSMCRHFCSHSTPISRKKNWHHHSLGVGLLPTLPASHLAHPPRLLLHQPVRRRLPHRHNHNSVDKFPPNSRLLNNFVALSILTTRNMKPSTFIDWFWGGLNYQIEHHLFPTMPRCNLSRAKDYVQAFCKENNLPYLVDDYITGYKANLQQLENMAKLVE
ncbi:hypothetical protein L596_024997 [Steinernema carpocapsae]|uniref:Fatty acid desaturase domain-containing protein n=1 Tax=Steinernema carpocapsae TaxID=34508 RepID=A0A4U5M6G8_STECR|nr:hypothetical protein L596_024997 [Steinernema carpocapsae]